MRASKDLARRLRFDRFPRPDFFRRHFLLAGIAATLAGLALWVAFTGTRRQRQYLPGPVSQNHATFGDRCEKCHTMFQAVANTACLECHPARTHSQFEVDTPNCRDCHVEHRPVQVFLSVSNGTCIRCHTQLRTRRSPTPLIDATISSFAVHPQFAPLRDDFKDHAAVRFNHKLHLTSDKIVRETVGPTGSLQCVDCHQVDVTGRYMQPIVFEPHCKRCHEQKPPSVTPGIEAPHKAPDIVRAELTAQLAVTGIQNADLIFKGRESTLPGIVNRPPLSQAASLQQYLDQETEKLEAMLYAPFIDSPPLIERNKYCFLCHVQEGTRAPGDLAKLVETKIPRRWLERGLFSHRKHDMLNCKTCHERAEQSSSTSDVNLPKKELCQRCHADSTQASAGTGCMLCHLYHDTSKTPALRAVKLKPVSLDSLTGH